MENDSNTPRIAPVAINPDPFPSPSEWIERETRQLALQKAIETSSHAGSAMVLADAERYYNWLTRNVADSNDKEGRNA